MKASTMITTGLYLLQCGNGKSSWKKWQSATFDLAKKYDRGLFTKQGVLDLYAELLQFAGSFRNYQKGDIRQPDFDWAEKYGHNVGICIGSDCYISFVPVAGYYKGGAI